MHHQPKVAGIPLRFLIGKVVNALQRWADKLLKMAHGSGGAAALHPRQEQQAVQLRLLPSKPYVLHLEAEERDLLPQALRRSDLMKSSINT